MKKIKVKCPGGFFDILPADYLAREKIIMKIDKIFRLFGFNPVETPIVEFAKTLAGEESETGKNIFFIEDKESKKEEQTLALRFDQTVPFARLLAANPYDAKKREGIRLPWRRMAFGPVFRKDSPQSGRYRQFYQFDADIAGTSSMIADAEIIAITFKVFKSLELGSFVIKINNRKILNGLSGLLAIKPRRKIKVASITKEILRIMDKIDKIGLEEVLKELQKKPKNNFDTAPNLPIESIEKIREFLDIKGNNSTKLDRCAGLFSSITIAQEGILELKQILDYLSAMEIPDKFIEISFSIARGLDYYTGPVMETILTKAPQFGSLCSGGRYDNLISRFTGKDISATGTSIGIDRLFAALDFLDITDRSTKTVIEVIVLKLIPDADKEYLRIADELRKIGLNTEMSLMDDITFNGQFNYAISRNVDYVVIYGEEELKKGTIQIKDLKTRKQKEMPRNKLKKYFKSKS